MVRRSLLVAVIAVLASTVFAAPAPDFGPNVLIFDQATPDIQAQVSAVFAKQEKAQFGTERYALLFKPGKYNADVRVGFYTSALGLGKSPDDVEVTGAVRADGQWMGGNATCTFWRGIENLSINPTQGRGSLTWSVSQATEFRRNHVKGNLNLSEGGWSSGGFVVDCKVDGNINNGSQQQYFLRNNEFTKYNGGVWNAVFVGDNKAPTSTWPRPPFTVVEKTPLIREKPYLVFDNDNYFVEVPGLQKDTVGTDWGKEGGVMIPIDKFYIAKAGTDTAETLNKALASGKNILLTPGLYDIEAPIKVDKPNQIILGIGYPTLTATKGNNLIDVADVDGVTIAGLLLQASMTQSDTLLQVGEQGAKADHSANPTFLFDIFTRTGGQINGKCNTFVEINSNNVVGDNFWLWRADHGTGAGWNSNYCKNGLIVNGNDVTCYGLFVEHTQEYLTLWNGNGGRTYFYQSELPYDPPNQAAYMNGDKKGFASYKVADTVTTHEAYGIGVYSVFSSGGVGLTNAIETPTGPGIKMTHLVAVKIKGPIDFVYNGTIPTGGMATYSNF
jgi:hypothetical protein